MLILGVHATSPSFEVFFYTGVDLLGPPSSISRSMLSGSRILDYSSGANNFYAVPYRTWFVGLGPLKTFYSLLFSIVPSPSSNSNGFYCWLGYFATVFNCSDILFLKNIITI